MNTEKMRSFCAIVEYGGFAKAAERLYCTQPNVSKQVWAIEQELGYPLFDRDGKRVKLNRNGRIAYHYCQRILAEFGEMKKAIFEENRRGDNPVSFGATNFVGIYFASKRLSGFKRQYPNVPVSFTIDFLNNILNLLMIQQISFALIPECEEVLQNERFFTRHFMDDEMRLVVSPQHPWAQRESVAPQELEDVSFLISQPESAARKFLDSRLAANAIHLRNTQDLYSAESIKQAILSNLGCSILSLHSVRNELRHGMMVCVPVRGLCFVRKLFVVHLSSKILTQEERLLIEAFCRPDD